MKTVFAAAAVILLAGACSSHNSGYTYNSGGYDNLVQKLDDAHQAAQKIKDARNEYQSYNADKNNYLENKAKQSWEEKKAEYKAKTDTLRSKSEQIKQDWNDIANGW